PAYLLLAWFHLETMRISYWMFSVVALPGKNLRDHAILNAILIFLYVMALTTIGSMIAGVLAGVGTVLYLIVQSIAGNALGWGDYWLDVMWYSAAIPGLVLVGMLKR